MKEVIKICCSLKRLGIFSLILEIMIFCVALLDSVFLVSLSVIFFIRYGDAISFIFHSAIFIE